MAPRTGPDAKGISLRELRAPGADVLLTCRPCGYTRTLALERVIERLIARRKGGTETGIRALAGLVDQPCRRCGALKFETRPAFKHMPGQGAPPPVAGR